LAGGFLKYGSAEPCIHLNDHHHNEKEAGGFKKLNRGVIEGGDSFFSPNSLYLAARKACCVLALNRLFRKKTLENFQQITYNLDQTQFVFINV
jgi:uncharacterized OsmC-like protein